MTPPLGFYSPETRHLNFRLSVADTDAMELILAHRRLTLTEIDNALTRRGLTTTRQRILELAKNVGVELREVARA